MIRSDKIIASLFGGVGFRQSPIVGYDIVDADNQTSQSGLFFQDATPLVTIKNIKEAQQDINGDATAFNLYLKQLQESSIIEACRKIVNNQSDFIRTNNLYPFEKTFENTITTINRFVGFEINPNCSINNILKISWIELSFDSDTTFDIYLFNSNLSTPIQAKSITTSKDESIIVNLDWYISDDVAHKGGKFYLGYFDEDLGLARAFRKDFENSNLQINTPNYYITPVNLNHNSNILDVKSTRESSDVYGLNIGVDVYNDYTELIIRNKNLFWETIQLQMAEKCLNVFRTSTRANRTERSTGGFDDADFELYGNKDLGIDGVDGKLASAINNLRNMLFRRVRIIRGTLV